MLQERLLYQSCGYELHNEIVGNNFSIHAKDWIAAEIHAINGNRCRYNQPELNICGTRGLETHRMLQMSWWQQKCIYTHRTFIHRRHLHLRQYLASLNTITKHDGFAHDGLSACIGMYTISDLTIGHTSNIHWIWIVFWEISIPVVLYHRKKRIAEI